MCIIFIFNFFLKMKPSYFIVNSYKQTDILHLCINIYFLFVFCIFCRFFLIFLFICARSHSFLFVLFRFCKIYFFLLFIYNLYIFWYQFFFSYARGDDLIIGRLHHEFWLKEKKRVVNEALNFLVFKFLFISKMSTNLIITITLDHP